MNIIKERSEVYQTVVDACSYFLRTDKNASDYREYIDGRLSKDLQATYEIGYFPENYEKLLYYVDLPTLQKYNLVYPRYESNGEVMVGHFQSHNLLMPFRDAYGNIMSLMGRTILPDSQQKERQIQKYKYSIGADKDLYISRRDQEVKN